MDTATRTIPDGLAQLAPGPGLAALLAEVDLATVSDDDIVDVMIARDRQGAHERARFLAAVLETALRSSAAAGCAPGELGRYAADEVRAGLMVTSRGADMLVEFACEIFLRLPRLGDGMLGGELDESRARKFTNGTCGLPDELAHKVCEKLVPRASGWTTSQLAERIRREIVALDPEWVGKRYEKALEERDVSAFLGPEGTATVTGRHLPVDRAAAISDRLDRLSKSAKTDGDPRRIGHLRAELFLGLLDGTYLGLTDTQILAHLAANRPDPDEDDLEDPGSDDPDGDPGDTGPGGAGPDLEGSDPDDPGPDDPGPDDPGPDDPGPDEPDDDPCWADDDDADNPEGADNAEAADNPEAAGAAEETLSRRPRVPARGGIELQVRLSTLLGSDEAPAELAGWGPVYAALARTIAARLGDAEWRWAITTPAGYLLACGITTVRPTGTRKGRRTDDVLEIAIPATLLDQLIELTNRHTDPKLAAWLPVLADIRRRIDFFRTDKPPPDPGRRFPTAALRREVEMALRRCVGVGCRRRATKSEIDHTIDHGHGGQTVGENLGPACGRDHGLKHHGGWALERTGPHTFTWTSPLDRRYDVHTPPVIEPYPAPEPSGIDPPEPWYRVDTGTPWQLSTTWGTPEGPEPCPEGWLEPQPDTGPELAPACLEVPPF